MNSPIRMINSRVIADGSAIVSQPPAPEGRAPAMLIQKMGAAGRSSSVKNHVAAGSNAPIALSKADNPPGPAAAYKICDLPTAV